MATTRSRASDLSQPQPLPYARAPEEWQSRAYTIHDVCDAATPAALNVVSLGLVYQHSLRSRHRPWTLLPAWHAGQAPELRQQRRECLQHMLRSARLGFLQLIGHVPELDLATGEVHDVREPWYLTSDLPLQLGHKILHKLDQEALLYGEPRGNVILYERTGIRTSLGAFDPTRITQFYSLLVRQGTPIVFEYGLNAWMEGLFRYHHGVTHIPGLRRENERP
jgi:hypothetical protein